MKVLVIVLFPYTFEVYARTENYEEYEMRIVAKSQEQADEVALVLCKELGLVCLGCVQAD